VAEAPGEEVLPADLFAGLPTAVDASPAPRGMPPPGAAVGTERGPFTVTDGGVVWTCSSCGRTNHLDTEICSVCGASLRDMLEPKQSRTKQRDPRLTAFVALAFPGVGHAYLGLWGQAVARAAIAILTLAAVVAGFTLDAAGARVMSFLFAVVALGLWIVSAHDAMREAQGRERETLLRGRAFMYLVLGLLGLLMLQLFIGASGDL
jgi:hypothetical protein